MQISVIICTWNRAEMLRRTLHEFLKLAIPENTDWEVLVVNNNCTDNTNLVVKELSSRLPVRMVMEKEQGLSAARNRGVRESNADLILWTDDDVLVDEYWLAIYADAMNRLADVAFFGGPVRPVFDGTPPRWLREGWHTVADAYAVRDFGNKVLEITEGRLPFGANYAVRREIQQRYLYDTKRGRKAKTLLSGEETHVMSSMLAAGHRGRWLPEASVQHVIGEERQTVRYVRDYYHATGVLERRLKTSESARNRTNAARTWASIPAWLLRKAVMGETQYRMARLTKPSVDWLPKLATASHLWGHLSEVLRERRHGQEREPRDVTTVSRGADDHKE